MYHTRIERLIPSCRRQCWPTKEASSLHPEQVCSNRQTNLTLFSKIYPEYEVRRIRSEDSWSSAVLSTHNYHWLTLSMWTSGEKVRKDATTQHSPSLYWKRGKRPMNMSGWRWYRASTGFWRPGSNNKGGKVKNLHLDTWTCPLHTDRALLSAWGPAWGSSGSPPGRRPAAPWWSPPGWTG